MMETLDQADAMLLSGSFGDFDTLIGDENDPRLQREELDDQLSNEKTEVILKELLDLARDVVSTEQAAPPIEQEERGKAALTELFEEAKSDDTPIMVERVVNDIDAIVRHVRFDGWQDTHAGEREVKKALRKTLFKYQLHSDTDLFDRAYGYIREYY